MNHNFSSPINIEKLMLSKMLEPLPSTKIAELQHIQEYSNVDTFNEAEVRSYIIDPILRVLGYDKGTPFSTRLESHLTFLGQKRRTDYHLTLWEENFWLIEAKRPRIGETSFTYEDFRQALGCSAKLMIWDSL